MVNSSHDLVYSEFQPLLLSFPSFDKFFQFILSNNGRLAGGPSGLHDIQSKHRPLEGTPAGICLSQHSLDDRTIPYSWLWKWLVLIPKSSSKKGSVLSPIKLMKVPLIYFCLQRLGVLKKLTELLVAIDFGGHSIIRFIIVLDTMDKNGIDKPWKRTRKQSRRSSMILGFSYINSQFFQKTYLG